MRIERLGNLGDAPRVLRSLGDATTGLDLPPPAALTGEWFDALAIIAPSLSVQPVDVNDAFAVQLDARTPDSAVAVGDRKSVV